MFDFLGFQTARQISNKLQEPRRLKKNPLAQPSINKFFLASTMPINIKKEPDEQEMEWQTNEKRQTDDLNDKNPTKRRKVEVQRGNFSVETEQVHTVNVKQEPNDSNGETDDESDDENGPTNTRPIKVEPENSSDTDEPSDDDGDRPIKTEPRDEEFSKGK